MSNKTTRICYSQSKTLMKVGQKARVNVAKINLQLPGSRGGVEAERNSEELLQNSVGLVETTTFCVFKACRRRGYGVFLCF